MGRGARTARAVRWPLRRRLRWHRARWIEQSRRRAGWQAARGGSPAPSGRSCTAVGRSVGGAPFGPEVFPMERRSLYETRVYANLCPFLSVDSAASADTLRRDKKDFETNEFRDSGARLSGSRSTGADPAGGEAAFAGPSAGGQATGQARKAAAQVDEKSIFFVRARRGGGRGAWTGRPAGRAQWKALRGLWGAGSDVRRGAAERAPRSSGAVHANSWKTIAFQHRWPVGAPGCARLRRTASCCVMRDTRRRHPICRMEEKGFDAGRAHACASGLPRLRHSLCSSSRP